MTKQDDMDDIEATDDQLVEEEHAPTEHGHLDADARALTETVHVEVQDASGVWRAYETGLPLNFQRIQLAMQTAAKNRFYQRVRAVDSKTGALVDVLTNVREMVRAAIAGDRKKFADLCERELRERAIAALERGKKRIADEVFNKGKE
jgi:hypothetical protein